MALTISVGFVVDDAIVMIENIVRYIEQGMRPFDAALKGAGQIGFTIISITFSLIAVFIPLFFYGRNHRPAVPRIRDHRVGRGGVLGDRVADPDPGLVLAVLERAGLHPAKGRFNRAAERFFERMIGAYDRGLNFVFRHQFPVLVSTLLLMVATGLSLCEDAKRASSRNRTPEPSLASSTPGEDASFLADGQDGPSSRRHHPPGSGRRRRLHARRRLRLQPDRERGSHLFGAEAVRPAQRYRRPDRATPTPEGGRRRRRQILYAGAAKHHRRRSPQPHAIPVHIDRHGRRGTQPLGADPRSRDAQIAGVAGCRLRPARRRADDDDRYRSRCRLPARPVGFGDRPDPL